MANPKGNPQNLKSYKPKWKSGKTQTIRIPTAIAPLVLEAAREIDENGNISLLQVIEDLKEQNKQFKKANSNLNTVTSDRKQLYEAFEDAIAIPSNRGGQIKIAVAAIAKLLGFSIQRSRKGWSISDSKSNKI